ALRRSRPGGALVAGVTALVAPRTRSSKRPQRFASPGLSKRTQVDGVEFCLVGISAKPWWPSVMMSAPDPGAGDRSCARIIVALAGLVAGAQALGFALPNGAFWGSDAYAFLPRTVFFGGIVLLAVAAYACRQIFLAPTATAPEGEDRAGHDSW